MTHDILVSITDILLQLGMPPHIKGYCYARKAILLVVEHPDIIASVTKELYPTIAKQYRTTFSGVEKAIRHSIEICWERMDETIKKTYFEAYVADLTRRPTNSEFIYAISEKVRPKAA